AARSHEHTQSMLRSALLSEERLQLIGSCRGNGKHMYGPPETESNDAETKPGQLPSDPFAMIVCPPIMSSVCERLWSNPVVRTNRVSLTFSGDLREIAR